MDANDRRKALADNEKAISNADSSFIAKGLALAAIRDGNLYPKRYGDGGFDAYTQEKWDMRGTHATRTINCAFVARSAAQIGYQLNEGQARELVNLRNDMDMVESVLAKVKADYDGKVTAENIRATRAILAPKAEKPAASTSSSALAKPGRPSITAVAARDGSEYIRTVEATLADSYLKPLSPAERDKLTLVLEAALARLSKGEF